MTEAEEAIVVLEAMLLNPMLDDAQRNALMLALDYLEEHDQGSKS